MRVHPAFPDLVMFEDDALAAALGSPVIERETVHEWPLSWVQRVVLADGRAFAYKAQLPPTVEPEFYDRAGSPLLCGHRSLEPIGNCRAMVIEWVDAPLLQEIAVDEADLIEHGRGVIAQIGRVTGDVPVHLDFGSPGAFRAIARTTVNNLEALVRKEFFRSTSLPQVDQVRAWSKDEGEISAISTGARLVHADLHADQIFCTSDGYRVIDWQRPIIGPGDMDLAALLINRGVDPGPYVPPAAIKAFWFHRLHWAVLAQAELFPDSAWPLFDHWSCEAVTALLAI